MCHTVSDNTEVIPTQMDRKLGDCSAKDMCDIGEVDEDIEELEVDELELVGASHACDAPRLKGAVELKMDSLIDHFGDTFEVQGWDIVHLRSDRYKMNGRKIRVFLLPSGTPIPEYSHSTRTYGREIADKTSMVMVHDGPLRQPLLDYLSQSGKNEHYDARGTENPVEVSGHARKLEYAVTKHALGDRIHAMKAATSQAVARRKATHDDVNLQAIPASINSNLRLPNLFGQRTV